MIKLSKAKRDQLIVVAIGTLLVVGGLWYLVIGAQQTALAQTIKKKSEAAARLAKGRLYVDNSAAIQSNLVVATERLRSLEDTMLSGDIYSSFFKTLNTFKESHSVRTTNSIYIADYKKETLVRFELMPDFPYTNAASFKVSVEAPYHDFGKFLADFENKFPHMIVNSLDLAVPNIPDASSPDKLSIDFEVVALVRPSSSP